MTMYVGFCYVLEMNSFSHAFEDTCLGRLRVLVNINQRMTIIGKCTYGAVGLLAYLTRKHNQIEYANILNQPWNVGNSS